MSVLALHVKEAFVRIALANIFVTAPVAGDFSIILKYILAWDVKPYSTNQYNQCLSDSHLSRNVPVNLVPLWFVLLLCFFIALAIVKLCFSVYFTFAYF